MHMHEYLITLRAYNFKDLHDISQWSEFATLVYYILFEAIQIEVRGY